MCILQLAPCLLGTESMNYKGAVTGCNFSSNFKSNCSFRSIGVGCWGGHTTRLNNQFYQTILVYCMSEVIVTPWFSPENSLNNWTQSDFQSTFRPTGSNIMILVESKLNEKIGWKIASFDCSLTLPDRGPILTCRLHR